VGKAKDVSPYHLNCGWVWTP